MHRKFLPAAIGALALFAAAAATTPVMACSRTDGRYEEPRVTKPLIEMNNLSAAQRAELKAYAQALKEQVGAIKAAADQAHPPAEKGAPSAGGHGAGRSNCRFWLSFLLKRHG